MQPLNACASSCCIEIETFADRARFSPSHQDRGQSTHANNVYRPFFFSQLFRTFLFGKQIVQTSQQQRTSSRKFY